MFKKYMLNRALSKMVEDKLYEMALDEVEKGILKKGAWARALSQSDGVDSKARSIYLRYRVESMKNENRIINAVIDEVRKTNKNINPRNQYIKKSSKNHIKTSNSIEPLESDRTQTIINFIIILAGVLSYIYIAYK